MANHKSSVKRAKQEKVRRMTNKTKTAKSKYKRIDADNRLKPTRDAVAELMGIDDTVFFSGNIEKVIGETECSIIKMTKTRIRTQDQALQDMGLCASL